MPFAFKYWGTLVGDSLFLDDWGSISITKDYNEEINFLGEDLNSRGNRKSGISYLVSGASPNRILKIEYKNVSLDGDSPTFSDSANVQCWLYETSNLLEFRYGVNKVKLTSWTDGGAWVGIYDENANKFISVESNPTNPTINTIDIDNMNPLTGMPVNGTIYTFTPITGSIKQAETKISIINHKIILSNQIDVKSVSIFNSLGQIIQSVSKAEDADLSNLNHGIYFIVIQTSNGVISEKKFL